MLPLPHIAFLSTTRNSQIHPGDGSVSDRILDAGTVAQQWNDKIEFTDIQIIPSQPLYTHLQYFPANSHRASQLATYAVHGWDWGISNSVELMPVPNQTYYVVLEGLWTPPRNRTLSAILLPADEYAKIRRPYTTDKVQVARISPAVDLTHIYTDSFMTLTGDDKRRVHDAIRGGDVYDTWVGVQSSDEEEEVQADVPVRTQSAVGLEPFAVYIQQYNLTRPPFIVNFARDQSILDQMHACLQQFPPAVWSGKWTGEEAVGEGVSREIFAVYWQQLETRGYLDSEIGMLTDKVKREEETLVLTTMARAIVYSIGNGYFPGHLNTTLVSLLCGDFFRRKLSLKWLQHRATENCPELVRYILPTWQEFRAIPESSQDVVTEEFGTVTELTYPSWYYSTLHHLVYGRYQLQLEIMHNEIQQLLVEAVPHNLVMNIMVQYRYLTVERIVDIVTVAHPRLMYLIGYLAIVLQTYPREKLWVFLRWLHGSRYLPKNITIRFQQQPGFLPSVNTCDASLWLTHYSSADDLGLQLDKALFHLDDGMLLG